MPFWQSARGAGAGPRGSGNRSRKAAGCAMPGAPPQKRQQNGAKKNAKKNWEKSCRSVRMRYRWVQIRWWLACRSIIDVPASCRPKRQISICPRAGRAAQARPTHRSMPLERTRRLFNRFCRLDLPICRLSRGSQQSQGAADRGDGGTYDGYPIFEPATLDEAISAFAPQEVRGASWRVARSLVQMRPARCGRA